MNTRPRTNFNKRILEQSFRPKIIFRGDVGDVSFLDSDLLASKSSSELRSLLGFSLECSLLSSLVINVRCLENKLQ